MSSKPGAPKRIRLVDVAREAKVSVQAASHVLSGNSTVRIPDSTRNRIREAAVKVGYVPNKFAQAIKTGRSNTVALWLPLDRPTTTYFRMLSRLSAKARESEYSLMIIGVDRDLAYRGAGAPPAHWPVDGVIAIDAGKAITAFREDPRNDATPVSVLALEEFRNADTIGWDVYGGAKSAVQRMIDSGRKKIVHVSPEWILRDYPREQRRRGYTEAMQEADLEPILISAPAETSDSAEVAMAEYLHRHGTPDAVFGFMDNLAIGASRAILAAGASIPSDCWVLGTGDTPEAADFRVSLSSLQVPVDRLIDQSWDWLMDRIANIEQPSRTAILPMRLVERESTVGMGTEDVVEAQLPHSVQSAKA